MNLIWRLIKTQLKRHLIILVILFIIVAAVSATPYAFSFLGKWLIDEVLQVTGPPKPKAATAPSQAPEEPSQAAESEKPSVALEWKAKTAEEKLRLLMIFLAASLGMHVVVTGLSALSELLKSRMNNQMIYHLRTSVHDKLASMEMLFFSREQVGQLMTRVLDDVSGVPGNLTQLVINFCTQIVMLALGASLLLKLNPQMTLIALGVLPFYRKQARKLPLSCLFSVRDRCFFLLGVNIGARVSELTALKISDVWQHSRPVDILTLRKDTVKGKKESHFVPLNETAKAVISELIAWKEMQGEDTSQQAYLFASRKGGGRLSRVQAHRILKKAYDKASLTGKVTTHSMRKTVANTVYSSTGDLFVVKEILGHQNLTTTQKYLGVGFDKLQDAMDTIDECNIIDNTLHSQEERQRDRVQKGFRRRRKALKLSKSKDGKVVSFEKNR